MSIRAYRTALLGSCACLLLIGLSNLQTRKPRQPSFPRSSSPQQNRSQSRGGCMSRRRASGAGTPAAQLNTKADAFDQSRSESTQPSGTSFRCHHPRDD